MAKILPFKAVRYNQEKAGTLEKVTAPPYDVISPEEKDKLYKKSDYNIIRLILGKNFPEDTPKNNNYTRSADFFQKWLKEDILREDDTPAIYVYEQEYTHGNITRSRRGFFALLRLEDFKKKIVHPHEETLSRPRADRLRLLRSCQANLSPIFALYSDPTGMTDKLLDSHQTPLMEMVDERSKGDKHRIWAVTSEEIITKLKKFLNDKKIYIADGHHRYETALNYRNEMRHQTSSYTGEEPYNYLLVYFTNMDDEELLILPAHRLISGLGDFKITDLAEKLNELFETTLLSDDEKGNGLKTVSSALARREDNEHIFGMYGQNKFYILKLKDTALIDKLIEKNKSLNWKKLDVTILHHLILNTVLGEGKPLDEENISYVTDSEKAFQSVRDGKFQLAFFINPIKVSQMKDIAGIGEKMPGKATYFYPKIPTGLLMRQLRGHNT